MSCHPERSVCIQILRDAQNDTLVVRFDFDTALFIFIGLDFQFSLDIFPGGHS